MTMDNFVDEKILLTLRDKDIFPETSPDVANITWHDRIVCKVVLLDEKNNIALIGNKVHDLFLLPGGGLEDGEGLRDGAKRECREETGCEIEILGDLGMTEDYRTRESRHSVNYAYLAKVRSLGEPSLTEKEKDIGLYTRWVALETAVHLLVSQEERIRRGEVEYYNTCFNAIRDAFFVRKSFSSIARPIPSFREFS